MKYIFFISFIVCLFSCEETIQKQKTSNSNVSEIEQINREINGSPSVHNFNKRAKYYLNNEELELAFEDIKIAISLDSTKGETYFIGAQLFRKSLQIPLSLEYAKKAETKGFSSDELFLLMAEENLILMQYQASISYANKALKINKNLAKGYFYKGMVYEETNDFKRAVSSYQTALEQNTTFADAYCNLIKLYTANKDYKMANQYVESGLRFLPDDKFIWYNYGVLLQSQNLLDSALLTYKKAEVLDSTFDLVIYRIATISQKLNQYENAKKYYENVIKINPTFEIVYAEYGQFLLERKEKEKANTVLRKGLIQYPDNTEIQKLYKKSK